MSETSRTNHNTGTPLTTAEYHAVKARVDKCRRIKDDLRPLTGPYNRGRLQEIRDVERDASVGHDGYTEVRVYAQGYKPYRYSITHTSVSGEQCREEIVAFARHTNSNDWQWLSPDDQPGMALAINADLYDARLQSHTHPMYLAFDTTVIPRLDDRGAYTGVILLYEDKPEQAQD